MDPKSNVGLYLGALVILALLEVSFALGINAIRPSQDNTSLIVMVGAVLVPMVTSILNIINGERAKIAAEGVKKDLAVTQRTINGRMEELIKAAASAAHAQGYHVGKSEAILMLSTPPGAIPAPDAEAPAKGPATAAAPSKPIQSP